MKEKEPKKIKIIKKIVITGGSDAGKTTAMNWIQNNFEKKGDIMELDYKKMFENLQSQIKPLIEREELYFKLVRRITELKPYTDKMAKVMMDISMQDQISLMTPLVTYAETSKKLLEKYGLDDDIEIEEME